MIVDPSKWTESQVLQFAQWCISEYQLMVNIQLFQGITGVQLCSFTAQQFQGLAKESGPALHNFLEKIKASVPCKSV